MPSHAQATEIIRSAFSSVFGREPTDGERHGAQLIAWLESNYGRGWSDDPKKCPHGNCSGSNNWGAIIIRACPAPDVEPPCPDGFIYRDSYPDGSACYQCFRAHPTPEAGAAHLIRVLYERRPSVLAAAQIGSLPLIAETMYDTTYYTGFGPTREARIAGQLKRMREGYETILSGLGEAPALGDADITFAEETIVGRAPKRKSGVLGLVALGAIATVGTLALAGRR